MGKRLYITEAQSDYISKSIGRNVTIDLLPMFIQSAINNDSTPLSSILDKTIIESAISERTMELRSMFSDEISKVPTDKIERKLNKLLKICAKKEEPIKEQLEQLCYNTITQLFNIPKEGITYQCNIRDTIGQRQKQRTLPKNTTKVDKSEIDKRILINSLLIGGSMIIAENARPLYINELFEIDEELPHLYSKIIKLNEYLMLIKDTNDRLKNYSQSGIVEVTLGNDDTNTEILVKAINFPILLVESIKGLLELVASNGLPDSLEVANYVMQTADNPAYEPWHMRIGPYVWNEIIGNFDGADTTDLPYLLEILVKQPPLKFFNLINNFIYKSEKSEKLAAKIIDMASYKIKYNDYNGDLLQPSTEKFAINDSSN